MIESHEPDTSAPELEDEKELELQIKEPSFKKLVRKTSQSADQPIKEEKELIDEILDNPVNLELLPLTLQSIDEFQILLENIQRLHPKANKLHEQLTKIEPLLELFALHFKIMLEVIANGKGHSLDTILSKEDYTPVRDLYKLNIKDPVMSPVVLEESLKYIVQNLFMQLYKQLHKINVPKPSVNLDDAAVEIQIVRSKMEAVIMYLPKIIQSNRGDLFAVMKTHPRWLVLNNYVVYRQTAPKHIIKKEYDLIYRVVNIASATLNSEGQGNGLFKDLVHFSGPMYYWLFKEKADRVARYTISNAQPANVLKLWNLPETKLVKNAWKLAYPSIATNLKIHIPRVFPELTKDKLQKEIDGDLVITVDPEEYMILRQTFQKQRKFELAALKKASKHKIQVRLLYHRSYDPEEYFKKISKKIVSRSPQPISRQPMIEESKGEMQRHSASPITRAPKLSLFDKFTKWKDGIGDIVSNHVDSALGRDATVMDKELKEVVIHIHGGGFVSMSSGSHQNYTRRWAKSLKRPVFSIDYRLAPEHPFPAALDDCWQFYNWFLTFSQDLLGFTPEKIILAGDSAGGNLALVLTLKAIKSGIRVPDGILAIYPALSLDPNQFSPSLLNAMEDSMLSYSFLKVCLAAYVPQDCDPSTNYYLSPIHSPDELLMKLPPIRIMVGENDPLLDDSWRLLERLVLLKKDIKMKVFKFLPHAFLSYDTNSGYKIIIEDCVELFRELFAKADQSVTTTNSVGDKKN